MSRIDVLETSLEANPATFDQYHELIELYLEKGLKNRVLELIHIALHFIEEKNPSIEISYGIACSIISYWKLDRYVKPGSLRLNLSEQRKMSLVEVKEILQKLSLQRDSQFHQRILLKLAYVNECLGLLAEALTILSDLITLQADNGVELAYIIFKAAGKSYVELLLFINNYF